MNSTQTIAQFLNIKKDFPFEIKDKHGNKVYFEDSDGHWVKSKYDENNNEIYFKNSNGYWFKREYDKNGNMLYYENSKGRIMDNRHKTSCNNKIVEIEGKKYQLKEIK